MRRGLQPTLEGQRIARAQVNRPDLRWLFPERMAERLTGQVVTALRRRSKYILADLGSGETLIIHLGMSGRMLIWHPSSREALGEKRNDPLGQFHHEHPALEKHDHVVFEMQNGGRVTFNDPRRFGAMDLAQTDQLEDHWLIRNIGPEPLGNSFNETYLVARLKGRNTPMKSALLDQKIVAGLGNIYVCEELFRAGVSPKRKAGRLSAKRAAALVPVIRQVLTDAIEAGGSSLRDYRQTDGELGYFQHSFDVYDREGQPCRTPGCDSRIARIVQSGRSTFNCPTCQR